MLRAAIVLSSVLLVIGAASAEPGNMEKAKAHFIAGDALYKAGSYAEALREFLASYDFAPLPDLLLNAGQCYRKLGQLDKALEMYERYLVQTPKSDPWQKKVRHYIDEIHAQQAQEAERAAPPASSSPVTPAPVLSAPTPPTAAAPATPPPSPPSALAVAPRAPAGTVTSQPAHPRPVTRRAWFWATVAGGAVVVGGAIALGVALGTPRTLYPTPGLGSVPVR